MEPNNIENQIREKLNSREIKPTEMAWDRLDAMLTVAEEKKSKKGFSWLFIAACFLGMVTLGTIIYQLNTNEITIDNEVVNQEKNTKINDNTNDKIQNSKIIEQKNQVESNLSIEKNQEIIQSNNNIKLATRNSQIVNKNSIISQKTITIQKESLNQKPNLNKEIQFKNSENIVQLNSPTIIDTKTKIIVSNAESVSSEKLLAEVDKARKSVKQTKVVVNASSLLSQVNGEINKDYRETNFQKLKRKFETVKVAVANRNNQ